MQKIFLFFCLLTIGKFVTAQTLPPYTCGILYTYDNAGNRIKQEYYCRQARSIDTNAVSASFAQTDALYPNPNDGRFTIRFDKELKNADITITDVLGKRVSHFKVKGSTVHVDISNTSAGTYFIIIRDGKIEIRQKVIKQY